MTPPEVLRERLDQVWPGALAAAANSVQWERDEWTDALSGTIEAWRAAWEHRDTTRREQALAVLVRPGGEQLPERACEGCGQEIPADRHRAARFCADPCRRRATYLRERAAA